MVLAASNGEADAAYVSAIGGRAWTKEDAERPSASPAAGMIPTASQGEWQIAIVQTVQYRTGAAQDRTGTTASHSSAVAAGRPASGCGSALACTGGGRPRERATTVRRLTGIVSGDGSAL